MKEKVIGILKAHVDELADVEITDSTKLRNCFKIN